MKRKSLLLVFILVIVALMLLLLCFPVSGNPGASGTIEFKEETNPDFIGSYVLLRNNMGSRWVETGEWKNSFALFFDSNSCVRLSYDASGVFYASQGWEWKFQESSWNGDCWKLKKK